jgi:hypothetical protein
MKGLKMKQLMIIFNLFFVLIVIGCAQKPIYVELNKENIQGLGIEEISEIDLVTISSGESPETWKGVYKNIFPIRDSEKKQYILNSIKNAKYIEYSAPFRALLFKNKEIVYFLNIGWDKKACYGDFWESQELLEKFESWGLTHPKGEPNLPPSEKFKKGPFDKPLNL